LYIEEGNGKLSALFEILQVLYLGVFWWPDMEIFWEVLTMDY